MILVKLSNLVIFSFFYLTDKSLPRRHASSTLLLSQTSSKALKLSKSLSVSFYRTTRYASLSATLTIQLRNLRSTKERFGREVYGLMTPEWKGKEIKNKLRETEKKGKNACAAAYVI